jgi:integrase/recombinase XerD
MKTAIRGARNRSGIAGISPYTARHTVSTQLVVNGVHSHVKDQILGHAVDDMSRLYTSVPQEPLLKAINTLPVISAWANAPWMKDPIGMSKRYVEGMGARNDLKSVQKTSS